MPQPELFVFLQNRRSCAGADEQEVQIFKELGCESGSICEYSPECDHKRTFCEGRFEMTSVKKIQTHATGEIYSITHKSLGSLCVKRFHKNTNGWMAWKELDLLNHLSYANVAKVKGAFYQGVPTIVLEDLHGTGSALTL